VDCQTNLVRGIEVKKLILILALMSFSCVAHAQAPTDDPLNFNCEPLKTPNKGFSFSLSESLGAGAMITVDPIPDNSVTTIFMQFSPLQKFFFEDGKCFVKMAGKTVDSELELQILFSERVEVNGHMRFKGIVNKFKRLGKDMLTSQVAEQSCFLPPEKSGEITAQCEAAKRGIKYYKAAPPTERAMHGRVVR
jgi:hypothetical protein